MLSHTESEAQHDNVLQPEGEVTASEGETVMLGCEYNTSTTSAYLYWYKQEASNSPEFILSQFSIGPGETADGFWERFSGSLDSSSRSVRLRIQQLQPADSAVYYCTLQPTATGTSKAPHKNLLGDAATGTGEEHRLHPFTHYPD